MARKCSDPVIDIKEYWEAVSRAVARVTPPSLRGGQLLSETDEFGDAILAVLKGIKEGSFDPTKGDLGGWAYTIAMRRAIQSRRWRRRKCEQNKIILNDHVLEDGTPLRDAIPEHVPDVPDERMAEIDGIINSEYFPPLYRKLIAMHYVDGLNHYQIAKILGLARTTVSGHMRRARAAILSQLQAQENSDELLQLQ